MFRKNALQPLLVQQRLLTRLSAHRQTISFSPLVAQRLGFPVQALQLRTVSAQQALKQLGKPIAQRRSSADTFRQFLLTRVFGRERNRSGTRNNLALQRLVFALELAALLAQPFLQPLMLLRGEQLAEDALARSRVGGKQFAELPLRQHNNLLELACINAKQLFDFGCYLANTADAAPAGKFYLGIRRFLRGAFSAQLCALIIGIALHAIRLPAIQKLQLNERFTCWVSIIATQARRAARPVFAVAACFTEQREANGVENHGFARTRVAAHQVHARRAKRAEIDDRFICVRAKRGHRQLQRPHFAPPSCPSSPFATSCSTPAITLRANVF